MLASAREWYKMKMITGDVPIRLTGVGKGVKLLLSKESIKSFKNLITEHQSKLTEYKMNSERYDNVGRLKNTPNQLIKNKIIQTRIHYLKYEIKTFHQNINNIFNGK